MEVIKYDKVLVNGLSKQESKKIPEDKWLVINLLGKLLDTIKD